MKICAIPGCGQLTTTSRCTTHALPPRDRRHQPHRRIYHTKAWHRCRTLVKQRDPICTVCHQRPTTIADHYPQTLREILASGGNPADPDNCRGVCHQCSGRVDGQRSRGVPAISGAAPTRLAGTAQSVRPRAKFG